MKLRVPSVMTALTALGVGVLLSASTGCASYSSLGIPRAVAVAPDPPPMCVALRGDATAVGTTEVTAAVAPAHDDSASATSTTTVAPKKPSETVKDQRALVYAKGT